MTDTIRQDTLEAISPGVIVALNSCVEACIDGEKGYALAAANVRDPMLKVLLRRYAAQRAEFVLALQTVIEGLGGFSENEGTTKGALHRGFTSARVAIEGRTDVVILGECERGEVAALEIYDHALDSMPLELLPPQVRILVVDQRAAIKLAHDDITREDLKHRLATA